MIPATLGGVRTYSRAEAARLATVSTARPASRRTSLDSTRRPTTIIWSSSRDWRATSGIPGACGAEWDCRARSYSGSFGPCCLAYVARAYAGGDPLELRGGRDRPLIPWRRSCGLLRVQRLDESDAPASKRADVAALLVGSSDCRDGGELSHSRRVPLSVCD